MSHVSNVIWEELLISTTTELVRINILVFEIERTVMITMHVKVNQRSSELAVLQEF